MIITLACKKRKVNEGETIKLTATTLNNEYQPMKDMDVHYLLKDKEGYITQYNGVSDEEGKSTIQYIGQGQGLVEFVVIHNKDTSNTLTIEDLPRVNDYPITLKCNHSSAHEGQLVKLTCTVGETTSPTPLIFRKQYLSEQGPEFTDYYAETDEKGEAILQYKAGCDERVKFYVLTDSSISNTITLVEDGCREVDRLYLKNSVDDTFGVLPQRVNFMVKAVNKNDEPVPNVGFSIPDIGITGITNEEGKSTCRYICKGEGFFNLKAYARNNVESNVYSFTDYYFKEALTTEDFDKELWAFSDGKGTATVTPDELKLVSIDEDAKYYFNVNYLRPPVKGEYVLKSENLGFCLGEDCNPISSIDYDLTIPSKWVFRAKMNSGNWLQQELKVDYKPRVDDKVTFELKDNYLTVLVNNVKIIKHKHLKQEPIQLFNPGFFVKGNNIVSMKDIGIVKNDN